MFEMYELELNRPVEPERFIKPFESGAVKFNIWAICTRHEPGFAVYRGVDRSSDWRRVVLNIYEQSIVTNALATGLRLADKIGGCKAVYVDGEAVC
jgi:hypothetical protein